MSVSLIRQLEAATERQRSGGKKKNAKRKAKPTIKFRTRTTVVYRTPTVKGADLERAQEETTKKRAKRAKKGGKLSKAAFLRRMALGRARAKRAKR